MAFLFALLHAATWSVLDHSLNLPKLGEELIKRPFLTIGLASFLLLVPLAITSFNKAISWMGAKQWKRLHLLVHPLILLGLIHWSMGTKTWHTETLVAIALVSAAWVLRTIPTKAQRAKSQQAA